MKKVNFIKALFFMIFCFCCFSAKTSHAQLTPGDIAIIGVNGDTRTTPVPPFTGTIAIIALVDIPSGTIVKITDYTYNGILFGASTSDGLLTWTISAAIPKGTVFSISFTNSVALPVIQPSTYGAVTKVGWTNGGIRPISNVSGDSWLVYTENAPGDYNFIYGFLNTNYNNPISTTYDTSTGWTIPGTIPSNQSSVLPTQLIGTNAFNTRVTYPGGTSLSAHFNSFNFPTSTQGTKEEFLNYIKTPTSWASTDAPVDAKDLTPGAGTGAFPGTQPIYTVTEGPTVNSVSSTASGTKKIGDIIPIVINFSENVTVITTGGIPRLTLNTIPTSYANYATGSGTSNLTFNYVVGAEQTSPDLNYAATSSLNLQGGTIKSAANLDAILTLPATSSPNSLGGSSNIIVDGIAPTVSSVTAVTPNGSYRSGQTIDINVNFSDAITVTGTPTLTLTTGTASYRSGSGTASLTFRYTVGANQISADLDYATTSSLALTGGTLKDAAGNDAILTLATPGTAGSLGFNANIIIDTTIPTVTGVSSTNGTYNIGWTIPIQIAFTESVVVTGTPQLALSVGLPAGNAPYASGTGTSTLTFNYTVAEGQNASDLDYTGTTALSLNGGSISDAAGNNATLTLASPGSPASLGANSTLVVNGTRPTISSIVRTGGAAALTKANTVNFTVTFSEAVDNVDITDFVLSNASSLTNLSITSLSGSGTTYTIAVNTGTEAQSGGLRLDLKSTGTGIVSLATSNVISGGYTAGQTYTIDRIAPTISPLTISSNNSNTQIAKTGDVVTLSMTASEDVNLPVVTINGNPATVTNTSSSSYTAAYTVTAGDPEGQITFTVNFSDAAGNAGAQLTTTTNSSKVIVDNVPITITSVSTSATDGPHGLGTNLPIEVTFSEPVTVTGTPRIALNSGGFANYIGGTGSNTLSFTYNVSSGQSSTQLDYSSSAALTLNGGTINDQNAIAAPLTLPAPGGVGSLADGRSIVVNGLIPTVLSINRKTPTTELTNASSVEYEVTFSEPVDGVDITDFQMANGSTGGTTITSVSGSGATYIVTLTTGLINGTFAISLKSAGTGIVNKVFNPIISGFGPSQTYTLDRIAPTITTATIRSNGAGNGVLAKPAEIITLSFTADEAINTPVVTISGNSATVQNTTVNNWVATYTMLATDNNGVIPFNISYADLAGNPGIATTTTTNSSAVTYDKTPPTLTSVTIASNNIANPGHAKPDDLVTLRLTTSETVLTPVVVIGGSTLTVLPSGLPNSYMAFYSVASSLSEGEIPFTINFRDQAGNDGTEVTTVTTGSMVTFDKTVPTISNVSISSNNPNPALAKPNDQVTLTFTASEAIQAGVLIDGLAATSISNVGNVYTATKTLTIANTEGVLSFSIGSTDLAGNAGVAISTTNDASSVTFDKTLPVAPNFLGVTPGDTQNTLTWFLNADYAKYELIGGTTSPSSNNVLTTVTAANATNPMSFTQNGLTNLTTYYYALRVSDAAGNMNTSARVTGTPLSSQTITFDQPVAAEYGSSFTITATSSSGLPVTLTSNEPTIATVSGNTVTIIGVNPSKSVAIIASQLGNANYLAAAAVVKTVPIVPRAVTITATAQTKVFGAVDPAIAAPTVSPALVGTDVSTGTLKRVVGENAGSYEIQQNTYSLDLSKYAINYVPADFTISKKSVTITPQQAYAKTYGENDPAFAYNFTPLVSPDVITGDLARAEGENVGTYNFDLGTLSAGANYNLMLSPLPQFTINKSVVTVTPITASIQYGDAEPVIGYNHTPALQSGDAFTGALARVAGDTPNNYLINQGTLALSNNYTLNFSPTPVNFVVLKKDISITPTAGQGKIYGDADGTINYTASPALLNGDTFSGALSRAPGTAVNNYLIGLGTLAASNPQNYNLQLGTENYAITKKAIQVTATAVSQVYGDADPVSLPYTLSAPLPNGDVFTGKLDRTAGTDVGTYPINLGNLALSAVNYDLSFVPADLSITPKAITITAVSDTKTYGDADPIFGYTGSAALISGNSYSGKLGRAPGEDVGSYALSIGDLKVNNNYTLTLNPGATLEINKKDIAVLADAKSKIYGGIDPELTYTSNPALVSGDAFTGALSRAPGEDVNTYVIGKGDLALSSNYNLNYTPANFSIGLQTINVTALAKSKVYGEADPALDYDFSPALKSGDTFTGALSRAPGENVNTYVIGKGDLALNSNYILNYTPADLTIGLKTIEVTAKAKSKVYGEADPALDYDFIPALKSGDTFTGALSRAPGENVNTYVIGKGDLALSSNYTLNYTPANLTIGLKTIEVTAIAKSKVYGEADPALDYDFSPALKSGDTFTGALLRVPGENVNTYIIGKGDLALSSNYALNYTPANLTIGLKTIEVTAKAKSKVYGEVDPALDYDFIPALKSGDTFTGALSRAPGENVNTYVIGKGDLALNSNYTLNYTPADLTIGLKTIEVTAIAKSKVYGEADPALDYDFIPALKSGDTFTGALLRAPGENVNTYVIGKGDLALSSNYTLNYTPANLTIGLKTIEVTAKAKSKMYGEADPALDYDFSPALKSGDTFTGALLRAPGENINTYIIGKGDLALNSNYTLNYTPANLTIGLKTIEVTAKAKSKVYGEADPALDYDFSPALKSGDTFTGALSRAPGENVNTYIIGKGDLALNSNYTLNYTPANLTIGLKTIEVTAIAKSKVYGEADPALDYDFSPALKSGDTFTGALSRAPGENVNTYAIGKGDLALNSNYTLNYTPANLTIGLKTINVAAIAKSKVYGEADPALDYDFSPALKSGDAFTGALSRAPGENVNTYVIGKGDLALSSNYTLNYTPANLTIGLKTINVTAKAKTKIYGQPDPAFDYDFIPELKSGDAFTGALTRLPGNHVGNYEIGQGGLTLSSNYVLAYTPANLAITPKTISVQIDQIRKTYGAPDPQLTYTVDPALESGDVFTGAITRSPGENKGNYVISKGTLAASTDYTVTLTDAPFLIDPAPLTITADPQSKFVGTANPVFTGKYTGFVNGEDVSVLSSKGIFTSVATINSPIGTYPIVPSGATAANYQITNINGVLTVKAGAPTNVLLAAVTLYENQPAGTKAGTLSSTADDQNATFTYSLVTGAGDTDNALFRIAGDQLFTTASLDYENKKVYSIRVSSTTQYGFSLDKIFNINLNNVNEIPTLDAIASKTICYTTTGQTIDLTGISAGPESGQNTTLTVTGSNAALLQRLTVASGSGGKGTISYRVKAGASGISTITVTVKDDGGTDNGGVDTYSRTFVLTVNPLPVIEINANMGSNNNSNSTDVSKGETLVLTASGGSTYVWAVHNSIISGQTSANLMVRPRETTTYTVTVTNASGCSEQKSFTVNVLDDLVKIKATNILTPNGDGYNDKWIIENIDFYPNNEVKIFDKAGRMVYSKRSYDNSWDGMLNGMPLAEGTYYYVIDFGKDRQKFKGFITIVREN